MRLHSLKLAGFKSFVDPTTLRFPHARTAIVGPNGCGKSNVIDAIRWVMGESSAKQLRGDAMSDVIFAGSVARKPVGQASVELVFENTFGQLGGAYSSYSELSVRRQVTRDGKSDYFLNGARCRRRDITDIFLGTGLGSRSYAVIGQGMINRLVEAKPDELRVFLEEAAGVSRYQARRKETHEHLEHTRLNLARLHDVANELASQMRSLKRQSQAAERYKQLQAEQRELQVELYSRNHQQAEQQQQQATARLTTQGEQLRVLHHQGQQTEQQYQTLSEQLRQRIANSDHEQQAWQQHEQTFSACDAALQQQQNNLARDQQQLTQLEQHIAELQQVIDSDQADLAQLCSQLAQTEHALTQLSQQEQANPDAAGLEQQIQQTQAALYQHEQQQRQQEQQRRQLEQQLHVLNRDIQRDSQQLEQNQRQQDQLRLAQLQREQHDLQQEIDDIQHSLQPDQQQYEQLQADYAALDVRALQQQLDALGRQILALTTEQQARQALLPAVAATDGQTTLGQQLQLRDDGQWCAVWLEVLLRDWLQALCMSPDQPLAAKQRSYWPASQLSHQLSHQSPHPPLPAPLHDLAPLAHQIIAPQLSLWQGIFVAPNLAIAQQKQALLAVGQSILSQDGYWLGVDWRVNLNAENPTVDSTDPNHSPSGQGELSQRRRLAEIEQQLQQLRPQLAQQQQQLQAQVAQQQQQQQQLDLLQKRIVQQQQTLNQRLLERARLESTVQARQQQSEQLQQQAEQLQFNLSDAETERAEQQFAQAELELRSAPIVQAVQHQQQQLSQLQQQRQQLRQQQTQQQQERQRLHVAQQTSLARQAALQQNHARQQQQVAQDRAQYQQLFAHYSEQQQQLPQFEAAYEQAWQDVQAVRQHGQARQQQLAQLQQQLQQLDSARQQYAQQERLLRDEMEQCRLSWQQHKTEIQQALAQLSALAATPDLQQKLAEQSHNALAERLDSVSQQLAKLGDLNLAAPAALAELSTRHDELQHQMQDLQDTIDQLERAMRQIDQETRSLFMDTFDRVNVELQALFPKVFGGGEARLSLDDDWQSGVRLMAQPPGKKNASIALLSGGEKALTALALVFAIFRLNPAPFCLLDEVDAPLDDANVQRFCHLLAELSQQVQFIYISHNKLAMTMADQLLGVTMPEAGVSRLVSVNLEQAAAFSTAQE